LKSYDLLSELREWTPRKPQLERKMSIGIERTAGKTGGLWDFKELEAFDGKMD